MLSLICHTKTELEAQGIWLGILDSQLSDIGMQHAQELDRIHSSRAYVAPSSHAQQFANIVLANEFSIVERFADRSMGTLTGRDYRETMAEFPRKKWLAWRRSYWVAPPGGESLFDISDRVLTAFRQILPVASAENVVIVCAPDVLRILIGFLIKKDEGDLMKIEIQSGVPYTINGDVE